MIKLGITKVVTYEKDGQNFESLTARLVMPVKSGDWPDAPKIEDVVGSMQSERPTLKSGSPANPAVG